MDHQFYDNDKHNDDNENKLYTLTTKLCLLWCLFCRRSPQLFFIVVVVVVLTWTHRYNAVRGHRTGSNNSVMEHHTMVIGKVSQDTARYKISNHSISSYTSYNTQQQRMDIQSRTTLLNYIILRVRWYGGSRDEHQCSTGQQQHRPALRAMESACINLTFYQVRMYPYPPIHVPDN